MADHKETRRTKTATSSKGMKPISTESQAVIDLENTRKSNRLKLQSKFEKRLHNFASNNKRLEKRKKDSDSSGEDENESPQKVTKKDNGMRANQKEKPNVKNKSVVVKSEEEEEENHEDGEEEETFNLGMFDLRRVGDESPQKTNSNSSVPLNRRGMPQRIRKKNKFFYDDNVVNTPILKSHRIKKESKKEAKEERKVQRVRSKVQEKRDEPDVKNFVQVEEPRDVYNLRQKIGMTLRNLLKLPKAQSWVYYEWFYSNIDRALFLGTNDFLECLKESFPHLKTFMMTRTQWCIARRLMGKPRRCSQAFFREERRTLETRRNAIRMIQQRKLKNFQVCKDLPDRIPLQLSVNSRVTARILKPQAGLFTGKVDAVDPSNHTYRITFDRPGLGTHSIPDYEVLLDGDADMVSLSTWQKRYINSKIKGSMAPKSSNSSDQKNYMSTKWTDNIAADFPAPFYEMIVRICKILKEKQAKVQKLRDMNDEAERLNSLSEPYPEPLQREYASVLIELEKLNISLKRFLNGVQKYCHDLAPEACEAAMLAPSYLVEKSVEEAHDILESELKDISDDSLPEIATQLLALLIQVLTLSEGKHNSHELQVLKKSTGLLKSMILPENQNTFRNNVEVHIQYIENTLGKGGPLAPLLSTASSLS